MNKIKKAKFKSNLFLIKLYMKTGSEVPTITRKLLRFVGSMPGTCDRGPFPCSCRIVYIGPRLRFATRELACSEVNVSN